MTRLYWSAHHETHWIAYTPDRMREEEAIRGFDLLIDQVSKRQDRLQRSDGHDHCSSSVNCGYAIY